MRALPTLLAVLALCACGPKKQDGLLFIDPTLEALIPSDAVFVVGANIDAIRDTPVYQRLLSQMDLPQLNQFTKQTGIDPRKDLQHVISVSNGKTGLLLARGKFNQHEVETRLQSEGAGRFDYKGQNLFGNDRGAVTFLDSSTAVAGPTPDIRQLIDRRGQPGQGLPPVLRDQLKALPATDQIWAALAGGIAGLNVGIPENSNLGGLLRMFQGLQTVRLGVDIRNGLDAQAAATCQTERDAKRVHDAVKGIVGIGRLSTPDNQPDLLKLYDAIQVTQNKAQTDVTAHIAPELVDHFVDLWLKRK